MYSNINHPNAELNYQQLQLPDKILDKIPLGCYMLNSNGIFIYINKKAEEILNIKRVDVLGRNIWSIFPKYISTPYYSGINNTIQSKSLFTYEYLSPVTFTPMSLTAEPMEDGTLVTFTEIKEIKPRLPEEQRRLKTVEKIGQVGYFEQYPDRQEQTEEDLALAHQELKQSNDLMLSVFDTSLIGVAILKAVRDENGKIKDFSITLANKELEKETRRTDLVGKWYAEEYPAIKKSGVFDLMLQVMETGKSEQTEYSYRHYGSDKWFSCMFVKMDDGLIATYLNITASMRSMEERQQQDIFIATVKTQEEERKRIAENLHNGIGQLLYAVKISLDQIVLTKNNVEQATFHQSKKATMQLLEKAMKESRRISHELTPAILEDFGLQKAIEDVCQQFASTIDIKCRFKGINRILNKYVEVSVYRIIQELVMNIVKHAEATEAGVEVELDRKTIIITVFDNGIGLNMGQSKRQGIGMQTINNKIKLLRGSIIINSTRGTSVTIRIPYE